MEENIDVRLTLASLLLEDGKEEETIALLSPPKNLGNLFGNFFIFLEGVYSLMASIQRYYDFSESTTDTSSVGPKPWWLSGKVKMHLAKIYHAKGMLEEFVDAIFSPIRETLFIETMNKKVIVCN